MGKIVPLFKNQIILSLKKRLGNTTKYHRYGLYFKTTMKYLKSNAIFAFESFLVNIANE